MASACVNNVIGVPSENFIDCAPSNFPAYGWLSPRISFSREYSDEEGDSDLFAGEKAPPAKKPPAAPEKSDPANDFEFRLDDPSTMLPADELISGGKLVPLQFAESKIPAAVETAEESIRSAEERRSCARNEAVRIADDPYLFSPKAPRCSSRWRELLGLKKNKQVNNSKSTSASTATTSFSSSSPTKAGKSTRQFLHRTSKSMSLFDASLRLPLLNVSDSEPLSISSSHNHDEFPSLSLDSDTKPYLNHPKVRMVKLRMVSVAENPIAPLIDHPSAPAPTNPAAIPRRLSMDSPRMNPSGKIVFESLERSCSSPSSLNGGPRCKNRGVERSYSANVRVAPVLNVPVCSLRGSSKSGVLGFGQLFSSRSKKKEGNGGNHYHRHCNSRLRRTSS